MFVIVNSGSVILGPMPWRKLFFENTLKDDLEIDITLPQTHTGVYDIDANTKILPVVISQEPVFNSKTERLNGPFWTITTTEATGSYTVESLPIEAVKNALKAKIAENRWKKEIDGVKVTIQGTEITALTDRTERNVYLQAYQLGNTGATWKFDEGWLVLSNAELLTIVNAIMGHVQTCFAWESGKVQEIENATTLEALDLIGLEYVV